jgi:hypothetical protein
MTGSSLALSAVSMAEVWLFQSRPRLESPQVLKVLTHLRFSVTPKMTPDVAAVTKAAACPPFW